VERGLIDDNGRITAAGSELRDTIEHDTDRHAAAILPALDDDAADELIALLRPLAQAVMTAGAVPAHNNMGVPWPPTQ
jgi:hypothetical protein